MEDGKFFYELGRFDQAQSRLERLLARTSDARLRANASHYLELIHKGITPHDEDLVYPRCFAQ